MQFADLKSKKSFNYLVEEKSPYLLQHAANPVNWYPWNKMAFQKASQEDKPIFLSIGYATCHWCHVMAHESFEDKEVAELLNRHFISIKVDREERPDVDKVYMDVCQSLTGSGGWPLSIFMTSEGRPFLAGTYFPKTSRGGMPGFVDLLNQIAAVWENDRERLLNASCKITEQMQSMQRAKTSAHIVNVETLKKSCLDLERTFDPRWGGFGTAPKFPMPHQLSLLLRWHKRSHDPRALEMVEKTLDAMRQGGICDQIGFGFHRYSVDEKWLVPHFEKMLYDQALLAMAYTEAYQATGKKRFGKSAREIFAYILRDMTSPEGGFYCAEDADSEGQEGLFYLWTPTEVKEHLGEKTGDLVCRLYDITDAGNIEGGRSIPHISLPLPDFASRVGMDLTSLENLLEDARNKLFDVREKRIHPLKDDKILTSWNGLMIAALAKGYQAFGNQEYICAARQAASFILKKLSSQNGRLLHRYRQGDAAYAGFLDDYAFPIWGLIELYEASFEVDYLEEAIALNRTMIDMFWDEDNGGLYFSGKDNEPLIAQSKEFSDGAIPSGNSVAALNFLRLGRMTGNVDLEKKAEQVIEAASGHIGGYGGGYAQLLSAIDFLLGPNQEIVITGNPSLQDTQEMIRAVHRRFLPHKALLFHHKGADATRLARLAPFVKNMVPGDEHPTAYVCEQYACQAPITEIGKLESILG